MPVVSPQVGPLLGAAASLRRLECPLLPDMTPLLACGALRELELYAGFSRETGERRAAAERCRAFLRDATALRELKLADWAGAPRLAVGFVAALASSGRAELRRLVLSDEDAYAVDDFLVRLMKALRPRDRAKCHQWQREAGLDVGRSAAWREERGG